MTTRILVRSLRRRFGVLTTQRRNFAPIVSISHGTSAKSAAVGATAVALGGLYWLGRNQLHCKELNLAEQAEVLYGNDPNVIYDLLHATVTKIMAADDNVVEDAQILWRYARSCHDKAAELSDKALKKELTYQGYEAAERAVQLDPYSSPCHKWMAIMISDVGDFEGLKQKLLKSYTMKEHFEKAIELNPADATSKHLLGVWCFSFADLPWYQRQAASAVFATPPSATYEEALTYFQAAETTEPGFYAKNAYYLGVTHARMGNKADAKQWLQACINMPASNADDREAHELAHAALKSL